jgi:hypothetical protein
VSAQLAQRRIPLKKKKNKKDPRRLLWEVDVVVSTALHEFFGIAVVEAIYCETFPILPRRLAYPELLPAAYHDCCTYSGPEGLLAHLLWALAHPHAARARELRPAVARFDWQPLPPRYDTLLRKLPPTTAAPPAGRSGCR